MSSSIPAAAATSRDDVGSSRRRTAGSRARARARQRRCCWPPERWEASVSSLSLTSSQSPVLLSAFSAAAGISPFGIPRTASSGIAILRYTLTGSTFGV